MTEPTRWTAQQKIDNLANQMDAERKARQHEKITAIWLRQEGKDIVVLLERDGLWYEAIREYEGTAYSHILEATGIRNAPLDKLTTADRKLAALTPSVLCEDCPPTGCPTNKTRCTPCPRR